MSLQIETQPFQFNSTVLGKSSAVFNSVSAVSLSGTFYGDGSRLTGVSNYNGSDLKALSGNWQSTYGTVSSLSANWNSAYTVATNYQNTSSFYATNNFVNTNFFNLTGGTISGATRINNNLTIFGNLSATGTTSLLIQYFLQQVH